MNRWILGLVAALALTLVVFALAPELDIAAARYFHGQSGFIGSSADARAWRDFFRITPYALLIMLLLAYLLQRMGIPQPFAPSGRAALFLILSLAIGPGLIVNTGLKDHAHRPRPVNVQEFGGPEAFRPWYRFDGACEKNCAFASGEAAQGFWMTAPALLVPPPWQGPAIAGALAFGAAASVLRLAFGGHFLSDVLVGGLIALIVVLATYRALLGRRRT